MGDDGTITPELQAAIKGICTELSVDPMVMDKYHAVATALIAAWSNGTRDRTDLRQLAILALEVWIHDKGLDRRA